MFGQLRPNRSVTKLPSHPYQAVNWSPDMGMRSGSRLRDHFDYMFPVVKYSPAAFQPGPVYRGGEAAKHGHQPWNFTDKWTAYSQPQGLALNHLHVYKGTQSAASYAVAQNAMAIILANRSGVNVGT